MTPDAPDTAQRILNALPLAGPNEQGLTVTQLATAANRHRLSIQRSLKTLVGTGEAVIVGKVATGKRGQPALRYARPVLTDPLPDGFTVPPIA